MRAGRPPRALAREPPVAGPRATLPAVTASSEVPSSFRSSSIRPGPLALIRIGVSETLSRRRLIAYLIRAELKKTGADTLLGNLWWVLDPLLQMLIYYVLVGVILQRGGKPDFPLFIFTAILPWKWFTETVQGGVGSVVLGERLIKQIYFPKLVLPVSVVTAGVVNFAFGLIPLVGLTIVLYPERLSAWLLLLPVVAAVQFVFSLAVAIAMSAANVFYRDIGNLARHILRFWFFLSPILYSEDLITKSDVVKEHHWFLTLYNLNPWKHLIESYRNVAYNSQPPDWAGLAGLLVVSLVLVAGATLLFKRVEPTFAKVL